MNARKQQQLRWTLSLLFGMIVAGVALSTAGGARSRDIRFE